VQPEVPSGGLPDSIKAHMKAAMAGHSSKTDSEEEEEEEEGEGEEEENNSAAAAA
jgi:hypothetical protein